MDQTFQRSIYAIDTHYKTDKFRAYFNLFSQQDSKSAIGNEELSAAEKTTLRNIGDNLQNAFTSGIDTLTDAFNESRVQYELRDTFYEVLNPVSNIQDTVFTSILIYSVDPNKAQYTARFSAVGQGRGHYRLLAASAANGRVYEWLAPEVETGQLRGDFEPVQRLVAPQKQQLYTLGSEVQINKNSNLKMEVALSNRDLNRFSDIDKEDNLGTALFADYQLVRGVEKDGWYLQSHLKYEFVQKNFRALNPYRNAEFNRDWNIGLTNFSASTNEHIGQGNFLIKKEDIFQIQYEFSSFFRKSIYTGRKHSFDTFYKKNGYDLKIYGSLLHTASDLENTQFFRPRIDFSKTFRQLQNWKLGIYGEREKNERRQILTDTLNAAGFYWDLYKIYLQSPTEGAFSWNIHYAKQYNYIPLGKQFQKMTTADEMNLQGYWNIQRSSQLKWNFSYRKLTVQANNPNTQPAQETYLGRLDYSLNLWRGALRFQSNYEIGSGQEAKVEFQFIRVNKGEGTFVWEANEQYDLNSDSIPQINEFVLAPFQDQANYVRINTFTNEFIRTNNVSLNQSLRLMPRAVWAHKTDWKKILSRLSTFSTLRITRKVKLGGDLSQWNPYDLTISDTSLVHMASSIRNVLFF